MANKLVKLLNNLINQVDYFAISCKRQNTSFQQGIYHCFWAAVEIVAYSKFNYGISWVKEI